MLLGVKLVLALCGFQELFVTCACPCCGRLGRVGRMPVSPVWWCLVASLPPLSKTTAGLCGVGRACATLV